MQKVLSCLMLSAALVGSSAAWAQDEGVSERSVSEISRGVFQSPLTISPRVGSLGFRDGNNAYTSRIVEGITLNWNPTEGYRIGGVNLGIESGLLFSHLGSAGSNFIGQNDQFGLGANAFLIPLDIVAGYHINDNVLVALNFGANAIYRSISNQMTFGRASDAGTGSSTEFFPNVGFNVGWSLGPSVGLSFRGDYIPVPNTSMYTATLGATFALA